MIYDWRTTIALAALRDLQLSAPLCLEGDGLWVCLVSSGQCTAALADPGALPPQTALAGQLILSRSPLELSPQGGSHLLCALLTGQAPAQFLAGLNSPPFLAKGETSPLPPS